MIPLGHGTARLVEKGTPLWDYILQCLNFGFGVRRINKTRFPGPLPVSLSRSDISDLFLGSQDMAATWKSDGDRAALVFATFHQKPICVCVDRALKMMLLPMDVPTFLTKATTVFDGELVLLRKDSIDSMDDQPSSSSLSQTRYLFETLDVPMISGKSLRNQHYCHRMQYGIDTLKVWDAALDIDPEQPTRAQDLKENALFQSLQEQYTHPLITQNKVGGGSPILFLTHPHSCFDISIKPLFAIQSIRLIIEELIALLAYPVDGLCFTPMQMPLQPMHCPSLKKWKWKNTLDFKWVRVTSEMIARYPWAPDLNVKLQHFYNTSTTDATATTTEHPDKFLLLVCDGFMEVLAIFSCQEVTDNDKNLMGDQLDGKVVECFFDHELQKWVPVTIRADRGYPNSHYTVDKTLINIIEGVKYEELTCDSKTVFHRDYRSPMAFKPVLI